MTTASLSLPRAAAEKASSAWASANGSAPVTSVAFRPGRPRDVADADDLRVARLLRPRRRERAERVLARGGEVGAARVQDRRADRRAEASTDAAIPMRQSRESTSATALRARLHRRPRDRRRGRRRPRWRSRRAPPTRVVFFVANAGNPRSPAASSWAPFAPTVGCVAALSPPPRPPPFPPQAATNRTGQREDGEQERAASHLRRKIASPRSDERQRLFFVHGLPPQRRPDSPSSATATPSPAT